MQHRTRRYIRKNIVRALDNKTIIFNLAVGDGSDLSTSRGREEVCIRMSTGRERERGEIEREYAWWSSAVWTRATIYIKKLFSAKNYKYNITCKIQKAYYFFFPAVKPDE